MQTSQREEIIVTQCGLGEIIEYTQFFKALFKIQIISLNSLNIILQWVDTAFGINAPYKAFKLVWFT